MDRTSRNDSLSRRHMGMDMDMGGGDMSLLWLPKVYWAFVGSAISAFTLVNVVNYLIYRQRLHLAAQHRLSPAKPRAFISGLYATLTAVAREVSNSSLPSFQLFKIRLAQPTVGRTLLVSAYIALAVTACLYSFDINDTYSFENIAWECGYVSVAQFPLIFLLAGKNNIVGFFTGMGYERLNWLHRWAARTLLITTTIHMAYWFVDWAPYSAPGYSYTKYMIYNDTVTQRGFASWCILVWIVFSSFAPIRKISYEFFILQHAVSYIALVTMAFLHTPIQVHGYLWAPVAIYFFDRVTRAVHITYINFSVFHPKQRCEGSPIGIWTCRAEFTPLPEDITRVTIKNPPMTWRVGQHAFFSCHAVAPLQSHPFTISSLPEDGKLEFYIRARKGGTKRFLDYAKKRFGLPRETNSTTRSTVPVLIDGPYGRMRPLRQFDSVALFAGSTGATFTIPHMRDIVRRWKLTASTGSSATSWLGSLKAPEIALTRRIHFVWAVKSRQQIKWFQHELNDVAEDMRALSQQIKGISLKISIYITCDDSLTAERNSYLVKQPAQHCLAGQLELSDSNSSESISSEEKGGITTACVNLDEVEVAEVDSREHLPPAVARLGHNSDSKSGSISKVTSLNRRVALDPSITLQAGRPALSHLIRDMLEVARGESAVVSCGPRSMNDECRRTTVALSDERAVHKGTGAMGIYYWGEGYGYA